MDVGQPKSITELKEFKYRMQNETYHVTLLTNPR